MSDEKIECYVLTATAGDVTLKRPSTNRHRIVETVHLLFCATPKEHVRWDMKITPETLTDEEFKALHAAWSDTFQGELMAINFGVELSEHASELMEAPTAESLPQVTKEDVEAKLSEIAGEPVTVEQEDEPDPAYGKAMVTGPDGEKVDLVKALDDAIAEGEAEEQAATAKAETLTESQAKVQEQFWPGSTAGKTIVPDPES